MIMFTSNNSSSHQKSLSTDLPNSSRSCLDKTNLDNKQRNTPSQRSQDKGKDKNYTKRESYRMKLEQDYIRYTETKDKTGGSKMQTILARLDRINNQISSVNSPELKSKSKFDYKNDYQDSNPLSPSSNVYSNRSSRQQEPIVSPKSSRQKDYISVNSYQSGDLQKFNSNQSEHKSSILLGLIKDQEDNTKLRNQKRESKSAHDLFSQRSNNSNQSHSNQFSQENLPSNKITSSNNSKLLNQNCLSNHKDDSKSQASIQKPNLNNIRDEIKQEIKNMEYKHSKNQQRNLNFDYQFGKNYDSSREASRSRDKPQKDLNYIPMSPNVQKSRNSFANEIKSAISPKSTISKDYQHLRYKSHDDIIKSSRELLSLSRSKLNKGLDGDKSPLAKFMSDNELLSANKTNNSNHKQYKSNSERMESNSKISRTPKSSIMSNIKEKESSAKKPKNSKNDLISEIIEANFGFDMQDSMAFELHEFLGLESLMNQHPGYNKERNGFLRNKNPVETRESKIANKQNPQVNKSKPNLSHNSSSSKVKDDNRSKIPESSRSRQPESSRSKPLESSRSKTSDTSRSRQDYKINVKTTDSSRSTRPAINCKDQNSSKNDNSMKKDSKPDSQIESARIMRDLTNITSAKKSTKITEKLALSNKTNSTQKRKKRIDCSQASLSSSKKRTEFSGDKKTDNLAIEILEGSDQKKSQDYNLMDLEDTRVAHSSRCSDKYNMKGEFQNDAPKLMKGVRVVDKVSNALKHKSKSVLDVKKKEKNISKSQAVKNTSDEYKKLRNIQNRLKGKTRDD